MIAIDKTNDVVHMKCDLYEMFFDISDVQAMLTTPKDDEGKSTLVLTLHRLDESIQITDDVDEIDRTRDRIYEWMKERNVGDTDLLPQFGLGSSDKSA